MLTNVKKIFKNVKTQKIQNTLGQNYDSKEMHFVKMHLKYFYFYFLGTI